MSTLRRIVTIGEAFRGDDGVGPAVAAALGDPPPGVEVIPCRDPADLVELVRGVAEVVVGDAVAASPAGRVLELSPEDCARDGATPMSSHGVGVLQALELAQVLHPGEVAPVRIVAVTIVPGPGVQTGLSPAVTDAVPQAAARAAAMVGWGWSPGGGESDA